MDTGRSHQEGPHSGHQTTPHAGEERTAANPRHKEEQLEAQIRQEHRALEGANTAIKRLREELEELRRGGHDELEQYRRDSVTITREMDTPWLKRARPRPPAERPYLSVLFLGACSGEWAARSFYSGVLPHTGGFIIEANDKRLLVDPGAGTFQSLMAEQQYPSFLDYIVATHAHWDCTRDLQLIIMAACPTITESKPPARAPLHLLAHRSVLNGLPMPDAKQLADVVGKALDSRDITKESVPDFTKRLRNFRCIYPAALNPYDLLVRLQGRYQELTVGGTISIPTGEAAHHAGTGEEPGRAAEHVDIHCRKATHAVTYGDPETPSLDIVVTGQSGKRLRCVYICTTGGISARG